MTTTTITEQIEAASQKDIIALMRSLKNAAYSHGVTDQTEYYSDKKYRVAYEKSEAAFEELRAAIASLQAEVKRLRKPAMTNAELEREAECLANDFSAGSYDESCWGAEIFDLAKKYRG